jgi:hypothetical protein
MSSIALANQMVQVSTEAKTSPTITALTTMSAAMNMPQGDRSRGNVSAMGEGVAVAGATGVALAGTSAAGAAGIDGGVCAVAKAGSSKHRASRAAPSAWRVEMCRIPLVMARFMVVCLRVTL